MRSNVKGYRQKRRFWNRLKKQERLHKEELKFWDKAHSDYFVESRDGWSYKNVSLQKELEYKEKECNAYKRELLMFQIGMFIIFVISLIKVIL